jgi:D-tyrosyl-tRNA(Tyr) deacylase
MIVVIQRVNSANVVISGSVKSEINQGLLLLLGIENEDGQEDITWLVQKIINMRIFNDSTDVMNISVKDVNGEILLISQFTLQASTKKGNHPSYIKAAKPDITIPLYEEFIRSMELALVKSIGTGELVADMKISLVNDGPVTIILDSKDKK